MKRKSRIPVIAVTALLFIALGCLVLFMGAADEETALAQAEIEDVILQSKTKTIEPALPSQDTDAWNEKERLALNQRYMDDLKQYYAKESTAPEMLGNLHKGSLDAGGKNGDGYLDLVVRGGILDYKTAAIKIEGEKAHVEHTYCGWIVFIQEQPDGKFEVYMPINQNSSSTEMVREEGQWKILKNNDTDKRMQDDLPYYGSYTTYEEAYTAARELNPAQENPF